MKALGSLLCLLISLAAAGCVSESPVAAALCTGGAPAFSPDGRQIAFQRARGDYIDLWTRDLVTGEERIVERLERGRAGQPSWTPDGGLVYILAPATNTSYAAAKAKSREGCNLHLFRNGRKTRLTVGRWRDSTPHAAVDGRIYYVTKGMGVGREKSRGTPGIFAIDPGNPLAKPTLVYAPPSIHSAGVSQPVVSSDGKLLAWAELDGWDDIWHICVARLEKPSDFYMLTPPKMVAYEPNWAPDSRHLVFTGYQEGDGGWCVYSADVANGALKRLFPGREPAVSPDGRTLAFAADGMIRLTPISAALWPDAVAKAIAFCEEPEQTIWKAENPANGAKFPMTDAFKVGKDRTVFVRARFFYDGDASVYQDVVQCAYAESALGLDLYLAKGQPHFGLRDASASHVRVASPAAVTQPCEMTMTGIRTRDAFYLSVNDGPTLRHCFTRGSLALDTPKEVVVGSTFKPGSWVRCIEVGTGWPANVPQLMTGKDLLK